MDKVKVDINNSIAHISDIHIRYGSRHEEYKEVFQRTIDDLKIEKPKRIVLTGDLFHIKITLSPNSMVLAGWLMEEFSKIAPVDILLGNHDLNLQSLSQGNALDPIIKLLNNGYYITKENPTLTEHTGKDFGIYFFKESGFYEVEDDIVYGIYSCIDNEILNLTKKDPNKKYIALYHGPVYGCRGDNGYEIKGDDLMRLSTFDNFDIVMLGDIHEHQAFCPKGSKNESIAYSGSLIQQGFGESMEKGYLMWNLNSSTFKMKTILNDVGFSKLHISKGELVEERVDELILSNDPKKTRVEIVWEDYEENYSVEKEKQIEKIVKTKYGCDKVSVECSFIKKDEELNVSIDEEVDYSNSDEFIKLLKEFVENSEYDNEEEVVELSKKIDKELNYISEKGQKWFLDKMEVWNLYSFPEEKTEFTFNRLKGVTGIFGKNFNGKSNLIRVLVWILYKKMLGGGDSYRLVNMYTSDNKAGGRVYLTIASQKYYIERTVTVKKKRDGTPDVSYGIQYKKYTLKEDGSYKWENVDSETSATEKTERDNVIVKSVGKFDDFTKIVLQAQNGEGNYVSMSQQPKNDLINKYLGLEIFRDRYDFAKNKFNEIKARQKVLGNPKDYKLNIESEEKLLKSNEQIIETYKKEILEVEKEQEDYDKNILDKTKSLIKVEKTEHKTVDEINLAISKLNINNEKTKELIKNLEDWISKNFKKEVPNKNVLSFSEIESNIKSERNKFKNLRSEYIALEVWIKENPKQKEENIELINDEVIKIESALLKLRNKLEVSKGKKCPTCGNVEKKADQEIQKKCEEDLLRGEGVLSNTKEKLKKANNILKNNNEFDKSKNKFDSLKNSLISIKSQIENFNKDLEVSKNISKIKEHNISVENNSKKLESLRGVLSESEKHNERLENEIVLISKNKDAIEINLILEKEIEEFNFQKKGCKLRVYQLNEKITESKLKISIAKNNIINFKENLNKITEAEKSYGKYAIYLQAIHRDGIPARIIRNKLPIINHRINSILKNLVDFKIEMQIKTNGDIREIFYFNSPEKDALPMSQASGSQVFVGSVAIRDSLHFVSSLTKPSLCIIDEGFGSLDDELTMDMENVFEYLKNKYQNVLIITHKNEIKDFVDNIIQVSKETKSLTDEQIKENPKGGVSIFSVSY